MCETLIIIPFTKIDKSFVQVILSYVRKNHVKTLVKLYDFSDIILKNLMATPVLLLECDLHSKKRK